MPDSPTLFDISLIAALFHLVLAPAAALHAMMFKRDSRAAFGWIALCVLLPVAGPTLYALIGINRVQRRARRLALPGLQIGFERGRPARRRANPLTELPESQRALACIGERLSRHSMRPGNRVTPLANGEQAFSAMSAAIDGAQRSVFLCSYIFDFDSVGRSFVDRLAAAARRGVDVRVVVDGVGELYGRPRITRALRRAGIPCARFLPPRLLPPQLSVNLRNHHKILVCDGHTGFTGGMNISDRHMVDQAVRAEPVADLHFCIEGPVARQLESEFIRTWTFCTGDEHLPAPVSAVRTGSAACRTLTDGPDEDMDHLVMLLSATIAQARQRIDIMTPYFLPPREIVSALQTAALRGIDVRLVLPEASNLPFVHWATRNMLWELLFHGIRVSAQPPPFAHTKLLVVDDEYTLIGSTNWDSRSLRLNFELQVEIFDRRLAVDMRQRIDQAFDSGQAVTLEEVDGRSLPSRLRDSFCWLFSPYL